jgi:hypothetical protein
MFRPILPSSGVKMFCWGNCCFGCCIFLSWLQCVSFLEYAAKSAQERRHTNYSEYTNKQPHDTQKLHIHKILMEFHTCYRHMCPTAKAVSPTKHFNTW